MMIGRGILAGRGAPIAPLRRGIYGGFLRGDEDEKFGRKKWSACD